MSQYIRHLRAPLALMLALSLAACGSDDDGLAQDTGLQSDLAIAGQDTAAQPALQDQPSGTTPAPAASRPASSTPPRTTTPARPAPATSGTKETAGQAGTERAVVAIPAGTQLTLASNARVCSNTHRQGDTFTANLAQAVTVGGVTIPQGAQARVRIQEMRRSGNVNEPLVMVFAVDRITYGGTSYPIVAEVTNAQVEQVRSTSRTDDATKVAGGAAVGAVIGQILGKDTKSTVIGAATGAAAGTAVAMATGNYDGCIPQGGTIAIRLTQPVQVQAD